MNDFLSEGAEVEPSEHPFDAKRRWHVMDNSVSSTEWEEIVWTPDRVAVDSTEPKTSMRNGHGFVDSLAVDDRIVLLARALVSSISQLFRTYNSFLDHRHRDGSILSSMSKWKSTMAYLRLTHETLSRYHNFVLYM